MDATAEKTQQINDLPKLPSPDGDSLGVNGPRTYSKSDTPLTQDRSRFEPKTIWTYFIQSESAIKIGKSVRPSERIATLQRAHGFGLKFLAVVPAERLSESAAHFMFRHLRIRGEWYRPEPDLLSFIESLRPESKPFRTRPQVSKPDRVTISKLTAALPHYSRKKQWSISNLIEMLRNHSCETDPKVRAFLERGMAREMAAIEA